MYLPLQWGRDQLIAELCSNWTRGERTSTLQWGRDQLIAEFLRVNVTCNSYQLVLQWGRDQLIAEF